MKRLAVLAFLAAGCLIAMAQDASEVPADNTRVNERHRDEASPPACAPCLEVPVDSPMPWDLERRGLSPVARLVGLLSAT
jgi:hypothetical protein